MPEEEEDDEEEDMSGLEDFSDAGKYSCLVW